jgi:hypothetical protein
MLGIQSVKSILLRAGACAIAIFGLAGTGVAGTRVPLAALGHTTTEAELSCRALGRSQAFWSSAAIGTRSAIGQRGPQSGDGKTQMGAPGTQASESRTPTNHATASKTNAGTPVQSSPDAQAAGQYDVVTLRAGTVISVRLADTVNSNHNHTGDQFSGIVDPSVLIGDRAVIPRGTEAHVRMVEDKKGGRIHGHAEVRLELVSLVIHGRKVDVKSNTYDKKRGVLASKVKPEATASANTAGSLAVTRQPSSVADPVIAAFRAAKVETPAGSKIDFRLIAPFTFESHP